MTYVEGLARAVHSTGAANISMLVPASMATVIISAGINIPAGNYLQGHRAPSVAEGQTRQPAVVRGRVGGRTLPLSHPMCPSEAGGALEAGNMLATSTLQHHAFPLSAVIFCTHLMGPALSACKRTWLKIGSINVCKAICGPAHLTGHWKSRPWMGFGKGSLSHPPDHQ